MKNIVIFLAAGEKSLELERLEITQLVQNLNKIYDRKLKNIKLKLFKTGSDTEFTKESFENSEMVFLVSCDELTVQDLECFNFAFNRFKVNDTPRIATYFKKSETKNQKVIDFMRDLDISNNHYYSEFESVEELKNKILLNLITLEDNPKLEYVDNKILFEGEEVGTLENLDCILKNSMLQKLKGELAELKKQYTEAFMKSMEKDTKENRDEVTRLHSETQKMQETVENLELSILNAMLDLAKMSTKSNLQLMQIQAYKYLEQGDYQKADAILDFEQIKHNIDYTGKQIKTNDETGEQLRKTQVNNVETILTKIKTTTMSIELADRFERIEEYYQTAMQTEIEYKLEPKAAYKYANYLYEQNKFGESIKVSNLLLDYCVNNNEIKARLYNLLAINYNSLNDSNLSIEMYEKAIEYILKAPDLGENYSNLIECTNIFVNISTVYIKTNNLEKAQKYLFKNIRLIEPLLEKHLQYFGMPYAITCNNIANVLRDNFKYSEAEKYYLKAIEIHKVFYKNNPSVIEYLAMDYINLGVLYCKTSEFEKAEQANLKSIEIYTKLSKENPGMFKKRLAGNYNNWLFYIGIPKGMKNRKKYILKQLKL